MPIFLGTWDFVIVMFGQKPKARVAVFNRTEPLVEANIMVCIAQSHTMRCTGGTTWHTRTGDKRN